MAGFVFSWSGRRGSNSRPPPWQGGALPLSYFRRLRHEYSKGAGSGNRLIAQQRAVAERYDFLDVVRTPAGIRNRRAVLAEPAVKLEVLLLQAQTPRVLFLEELRVDLIQPLAHLIKGDFDLFLPVGGEVIDRVFEIPAALIHEDAHHSSLVHQFAVHAVRAGTVLADDHELPGVAIGLVDAFLAAGSELGGQIG